MEKHEICTNMMDNILYLKYDDHILTIECKARKNYILM